MVKGKSCFLKLRGKGLSDGTRVGRRIVTKVGLAKGSRGTALRKLKKSFYQTKASEDSHVSSDRGQVKRKQIAPQWRYKDSH